MSESTITPAQQAGNIAAAIFLTACFCCMVGVTIWLRGIDPTKERHRHEFEMEAVEAKAGEFVVVDSSTGKTEFLWNYQLEEDPPTPE